VQYLFGHALSFKRYLKRLQKSIDEYIKSLFTPFYKRKKKEEKNIQIKKLPNFGYFSEYMGTTYFLPF
jgi:hypothetical protein